MPEINQLTASDEVSGADQVPIFSSANGDARKASISVIADYVQSLVTENGGFEPQYHAPSATGSSVTINPTTDGGSVHLLMTPTAAFAAASIAMPEVAECVHGQEVLVTSTQIITTLTVSGNGATMNGAPTTMAVNDFFKMRFDGVFNAWYRVG